MANQPPERQSLRAMVRDDLDANPQRREMLFPFGFLITPATVQFEQDAFLFYGNWPSVAAGGFEIRHHPDQSVFTLEGDSRTLFLVGHAYDPIEMVHEESEILRRMDAALRAGGQAGYVEALNRLTGVFATGVVSGEHITVYGDAAGMQTVFYGIIDGSPHITSHAALIGSLYGLETTDYVRRLIGYRFYHLFGYSLPGDLAPYAELRRLVPNHLIRWRGGDFTVERFFPVVSLAVSPEEEGYREAVGTATQILRNSMSLIAEKWQMPAISLTGGCDSQTTLACAVGLYDRFKYFSYVSSAEEEVDASAAKGISEAMGLRHELIPIPTEAVRERADFDEISRILELNYGELGPVGSSEAAKRIVLRESHVQLEVKSWVSEVARAYYHKRFLKRRFPERPSARYLTTLYKVFLHDRPLVRATDEIFEDYLTRYCSDRIFDQMDWWDLVFWEFRVGAWNGSVITGDHRFSFDIEIPYNNRLLLQALLTTPVGARIADQPHRDIRDLANPQINKLGVSVVNVKHTPLRARLERVYLEVHSRLPI